MNKEIKDNIKSLSEKASKSSNATEAMQFAQAALNLANTLLSVNEVN